MVFEFRTSQTWDDYGKQLQYLDFWECFNCRTLSKNFLCACLVNQKQLGRKKAVTAVTGVKKLTFGCHLDERGRGGVDGCLELAGWHQSVNG